MKTILILKENLNIPSDVWYYIGLFTDKYVNTLSQTSKFFHKLLKPQRKVYFENYANFRRKLEKLKVDLLYVKKSISQSEIPYLNGYSYSFNGYNLVENYFIIHIINSFNITGLLDIYKKYFLFRQSILINLNKHKICVKLKISDLIIEFFNAIDSYNDTKNQKLSIVIQKIRNNLNIHRGMYKGRDNLIKYLDSFI